MKTWTIYCHINKINGKRYIGQTSRQKLNLRWKSGYGYALKDQKIFAEAIKKYRWENFNHQVLESGIKTLEEANKREKYWISYYNTWIYSQNCNGYNMTEGGDSVVHHKAWNKGKPQSEKQKLEHSKRMSGRKLSEEHKKAISAGLQRKENTHNKAIKCIELNKIYKSAAVASAELNILRTSITNCLHKRSNTAGGYHWEFFKEEN